MHQRAYRPLWPCPALIIPLQPYKSLTLQEWYEIPQCLVLKVSGPFFQDNGVLWLIFQSIFINIHYNDSVKRSVQPTQVLQENIATRHYFTRYLKMIFLYQFFFVQLTLT